MRNRLNTYVVFIKFSKLLGNRFVGGHLTVPMEVGGARSTLECYEFAGAQAAEY